MRFLFFLFFLLVLFFCVCGSFCTASRREEPGGGTGLVLVLFLVLGVLTDSASLCREAFMRSGLRGGGSGGSDAAIVGPAARPLICIPPPLAPTTTLYCTVLYCARLTGILYILYTQQQLDTTSTHTLAHTHTSTATIGSMRSPL